MGQNYHEISPIIGREKTVVNMISGLNTAT